MWGQADVFPLGGDFPTTSWEVSDSLADNYTLTVLPAAPPGPYQLIVGMYDPITGQRLPITNAAGEAQGDAVQIETITIAP